MSMQDYEKAVTLIEDDGTGEFNGVKPESLVLKAEEALGLKFPPTYRRFLLKLGAGGFNGFELYGVIDDDFVNSSVPDAIWLTLDERAAYGLGNQYVLISSGGDGTYHAIDTSKTNESGENPVVILSVDGQYVETIANNFGTYFLDEITAAL